MAQERKRRSALKAISWRVLGTLITMTIIFVCTGEVTLSVAAGGLDALLKMILYFFHERAWDNVSWGRARYKPFVLWFTGLPGSGKSTLANAVADEFKQREVNFEKLDGDVIRKIFPETGYSKDERNNHIKRIGHLASMLEKRGVIVVNSFISPYKESREFAREISANFVEVYLDTPLAECEKRDPKGYYHDARSGKLDHFTGIDDPYEEPRDAELKINTAQRGVAECTQEILTYLEKRGFIA